MLSFLLSPTPVKHGIFCRHIRRVQHVSHNNCWYNSEMADLKNLKTQFLEYLEIARQRRVRLWRKK